MTPIVRAMRASVARRDNWAQMRIGACALLLPPLTLGAAFYSMLAAPDEGTARPSGMAADTQVVRPELPRDTTPALAVGGQTLLPIAAPDQLAPERGVLASAPNAPPALLSWPAPAEASRALLPRALVPPGKPSSQVPPPRMTAQTPAAHAPSAAAPPSAEGPAASPPPARKHARSETVAAAPRQIAQPSEPEFSLRDWLQQIGIVPRDTGG